MQKTKGISLIVLVITIIVMIVLAGAIILTLNNSGIIDKASNAVEETDLATVKELAQMKWAEAYAGGERTEEGLKAAVDKALSDNKVDTTKYVIEVTTKGVTVELKGEAKAKWIQQGLTVTNGTVTLEIGDSIAYDETKGGEVTGLTATDWKILGASDEGELLIMSDSDVTTYRLGYKSTTTDSAQKLKESQEAWLNGAADLDEICEAYGKGEGATGARSITVEDINRVTGYDPETEKYGEGTLYEYGNAVTYSYNGTKRPAYTSTNKKGGALSSTHTNGFHYYNGTNFVVADLSAATGIITTLKNNYYNYYMPEIEGFDTSSKASIMLFGEYYSEDDCFEDVHYYIASPCIIANTYAAHFGMRGVFNGKVDYFYLWISTGTTDYREYGVRAVVSLSYDINITGSSASGWTF